jgi:hypothetical protein
LLPTILTTPAPAVSLAVHFCSELVQTSRLPVGTAPRGRAAGSGVENTADNEPVGEPVLRVLYSLPHVRSRGGGGGRLPPSSYFMDFKLPLATVSQSLPPALSVSLSLPPRVPGASVDKRPVLCAGTPVTLDFR